MQLSLFQPVVFDSAERLLEMLNDGLKKTFVSQFYFEEKGLFVFMAADDYPGKGGHVVFNVLDAFGKIPKDFPANWRIWSIVKQELELYKP